MSWELLHFKKSEEEITCAWLNLLERLKELAR